MQMPPGVASRSRRAATFPPSPEVRSPPTITSPRWMPMRSSILPIRRQIGVAWAEGPLHFHRALSGGESAREFGEKVVTWAIDDTTVVGAPGIGHQLALGGQAPE